jgi:predicted outer membrane repeat protein
MKNILITTRWNTKHYLIIAWFSLFLLLTLYAQAQTVYTVNTLTDANPAGAGVGSGNTGDLRYVITQSNANPSAIASEPNQIKFSVSGQINLAGALPNIVSSVAIIGHEGGTTINRSTGGNYRLLTIDFNAVSIYLEKLTFQSGIADFGGAIRNNGVYLSIYQCKFLNNTATNGGGAILSTTGGTLELGLSLFQGNQATNQGGALLIDNYYATFNNAFINNSAEQGGAVFIDANAVGEMSNCTFSGNLANKNGIVGAKQGGAIYNNGELRLVNCTITLNTALAGQGGGVFNSAMSFGLSLQNNILAENTSGGDLKNEGVISQNIKNLVMDCNSCGLTWFSTADPAILALQDNGGFTPTHALSNTSSVINQGERNSAPLEDQRGFIRVGLPDLGAYEFAAPLNGGRGTALNLDGNSQYAHTFIPLMADRDDNFSLEVWVKLLEAPIGNAVVVYNGQKGTNGYGIIINNARQAVFQINNEIVGTFGEVPLNKWTHLAITRLNVDYKGFVNGFATTFTHHNEPDFPTNGVFIGGTPNGEFFKGQIDEVRVWSNFKTQDEFRTSMHTTSLGYEADLSHYYQFNQGAVNEDFVGGRKLILINNAPSIPSDVPVDVISKVDVVSHIVLDPNGNTQSIGGLEINWGAVIPNGQLMVNYVRDSPSNSPGIAFGGAYWIINNFGTNQTFSPISLKFRFPDEVNLDTDVNKYVLHKRPTGTIGAWTMIKHGVAGITVTVSNTAGDKFVQFTADATNTQLISFSEFVITQSSNPLPIRLLSFEGKRLDNEQVILKWKTTMELNNQGFSIEKSDNGASFQTIAWVDGAGTTVETREYQLKVNQSKGAYFRLKQVDFDNTSYFSPVVFVEGAEEKKLGKIYPNPIAEGKVWVEVNQTNTRLTISDLNGKIKWQTHINETAQLDVSTLEKGMYIFILSNAQKAEVKRLIVQ